jgi:hypothetical protein
LASRAVRIDETDREEAILKVTLKPDRPALDIRGIGFQTPMRSRNLGNHTALTAIGRSSPSSRLCLAQ